MNTRHPNRRRDWETHRLVSGTPDGERRSEEADEGVPVNTRYAHGAHFLAAQR